MSNFSGVQGLAGMTSPLAAQTDKVLQQSGGSKENAKIDKASKDFESILLGKWLEQAYQSFGSAPGEESGDDLDSGKEQFQGIAMQALGSAMTASGGIGIAKMISQHLHKSEAGSDAVADTAKTAGHP